MRQAARTDENQPAIVKALRCASYRVLILSRLGHGVPDLLVGTPDGRLALLEVKNPEQRPSDQRLTPDEARFHGEWQGLPIYQVRTAREAFERLGHECTKFDIDDHAKARCADCSRPLA